MYSTLLLIITDVQMITCRCHLSGGIGRNKDTVNLTEIPNIMTSDQRYAILTLSSAGFFHNDCLTGSHETC